MDIDMDMDENLESKSCLTFGTTLYVEALIDRFDTVVRNSITSHEMIVFTLHYLASVTTISTNLLVNKSTAQLLRVTFMRRLMQRSTISHTG